METGKRVFTTEFKRDALDLVERLITIERTQTEQRERWPTQQDEALTWRLRAEAAETRLKEGKKTCLYRKVST